jgi:hypothetical protein
MLLLIRKNLLPVAGIPVISKEYFGLINGSFILYLFIISKCDFVNEKGAIRIFCEFETCGRQGRKSQSTRAQIAIVGIKICISISFFSYWYFNVKAEISRWQRFPEIFCLNYHEQNFKILRLVVRFTS